MELKELKNRIIENRLNNINIIFKCLEDSSYFIADQYIDEICKNKKLKVEYIESINNLNDTDELDIFSFNDDSDILYILNVDNLENCKIKTKKNFVIKCKKTDIDETTNNIILTEINKLENWQIIDYTKYLLQGLEKCKVEWLCSICNYNIFRIYNEAIKISIFDKKQQSKIFDLMNEDNCFSDLSSLTIFNFTNAIIKKDYKTILNILIEYNNIDIEPIGVVTILEKNIKNLIDVQTNPLSSYSQLGMSEKQYNAIKYNCGKYSDNKLLNIFTEILDIDYKLKTGQLDNNKIVDYLLVKIIN